MNRQFKFSAVLVIILLTLCTVMSACNVNNDPKAWPKSGPAASVPKPEAGTVDLAKTVEDTDGGMISIINIIDFTADDLGDYIRLLVKKGYESSSGQKRVENYIYYTTKKGNKTVSLKFNDQTNELRLEIE